MSELSGAPILLLIITAVIVCFRVYVLVCTMWGYPLMHGQGYFFGVEVAPGFYDGPGIGWLQRFRTLVAAEHVVKAIALVAVLASGQWMYLPAWAGGGAVLFVTTQLGFLLYVRQTPGTPAQARSGVAAALETRRLGDYLSWPAETLCWMLAAASWGLLLFGDNPETQWRGPVILTYVALGLLPFKILWIRTGVPLPTERPEEHYRWVDAYRRYYVRIMNTAQWFLVIVLAGRAVIEVAESNGWLRWAFIVVALGMWLVMWFLILRDGTRLKKMGHGLRPLGSWSSPFHPVKPACSIGWLWTGFYFIGLIMLLLVFRA